MHCTEGISDMIGCKKEVVAHIQAVAPDAKSVHYCIHREAFFTENMHTDPKIVLDETVKIINFMKGCPLNVRLFFSSHWLI